MLNVSINVFELKNPFQNKKNMHMRENFIFNEAYNMESSNPNKTFFFCAMLFYVVFIIVVRAHTVFFKEKNSFSIN